MVMPFCPKCGAEVHEEMAFCPKCGAPLKAEMPSAEAVAPERYRREKEEKAEKAEKAEKREKEEKGERPEKYEKREVSAIGPLVGGLFLIFLGLALYLQVMGYTIWEFAGALFLIVVGIVIIVAGIYASRMFPRS
jgi:uncharacterized membrane protein YvbJ